MFRNVRALMHDWIPSRLPFREEQYNTIKSYLKVIDHESILLYTLLLRLASAGRLSILFNFLLILTLS